MQFDKHIVFKDRLEKILYDNVDYTYFFDCLYRGSKICEYGGFFMRSLIIKLLETNKPLPVINKQFISTVFSIISSNDTSPKKGRPHNSNKNDMITLIKEYYNEFKKKTNMQKILSTNLSYILGQISEQYYINITNNIILHFNKHIWKFLKSQFIKEYELAKDNDTLDIYYSDLESIYNDILNNTLKSDLIYHSFITATKKHILPDTYSNSKFETDVIKHTNKYIKCMYFLNKMIQKVEMKSYQIFPIKMSCYNTYLKINTSALIDIFYGQKGLDNETKYNYFAKAGDPMFQEHIWNIVFNLKSNNKYKYNRKNYSFNYEISTDGYGISINFIHNNEICNKETKKANFRKGRKKTNQAKNDMNNIEYKMFLNNKNDKKLKNMEKEKEQIKKLRQEKQKEFKQLSKEEQNKKLIELNKLKEFPYIDKILANESLRQEFLDKYNAGKIILCDPGKRSILYLMASNKKVKMPNKIHKKNNYGISVWNEHKIMNYTNKTRMRFTKAKKYKKFINKWKKTLVNSVSLEQLEAKMSEFNSKSCDFEEFINYVKLKMEYNIFAGKNYNLTYLQKLRWYTYLNKNKHENELLYQIENEFGKDIIIIMGDWSGKGKVKFNSTPNIALKRKLSQKI